MKTKLMKHAREQAQLGKIEEATAVRTLLESAKRRFKIQHENYQTVSGTDEIKVPDGTVLIIPLSETIVSGTALNNTEIHLINGQALLIKVKSGTIGSITLTGGPDVTVIASMAPEAKPSEELISNNTDSSGGGLW